MDSIGANKYVTPSYISSYSKYCGMIGAGWLNAGGFSQNEFTAWTSGLGVFVPLYLPWPYPVKRCFWVNGNTAAGNVDFGIFGANGYAKVFSTGNVAQAGTFVPQYVTPTAFTLPPGVYLMGISTSSTGALFFLTASAFDKLRFAGIMQQSAVNPLPAILSPTVISSKGIPLMGITKT
jgi:hypothetical protein